MQYDYSDIKKRAKEKEDENWAFRSFLKMHDDMTTEELDQIVFQITEKVWSGIDCTKCGHCCEQLKPILSEKDRLRLAQELRITIDQLQQKYLEYVEDDEDRGWRITQSPCPFLQKKKCSVYKVRPENCRDYPYLYEPDFTFRTIVMIGRTFTCPIVYQLFEELKGQLDFSEDFMNDMEMW